MLKKKYGVGIFGTGWVSGEHIKAYISNPSCEIKALASINKESAQAKKELFNLDCDILDTYDNLLEREDINIISICTAPLNRAEEIIKCCKAKKHFFAEIQICNNLKELKSIKSIYRNANVKGINSFVLQHNPMIMSIKSLVEKGGLGRLFFIETDYWHEIGPWYCGWWWAKQKKFSGSTTLKGGVHALATFIALGGEVSEVYAHSYRGHRKDFEYEPTYTSIVKFKNGAIGRTGGSFEIESPYIFNIIIHGSKGSVVNDKFYSTEIFKGQENWQMFTSTKPDSGHVEHHPFKAMVNTFIDYIDGKGNAEDINIDFAIKVHELALAIDKSAEIGKVIKLPLL
jgi:predicted dehydrogenase